MKLSNWNLSYFDSGEWQVVEEKLNDLAKQNIRTCPARKDVFKALELVSPAGVRVVILGQDPYPSYLHATGIAFSTPSTIKDLPPTLKNIFKEYAADLHYPEPTSGDLRKWVEQGVLLWNVIPTCTAGKPGSHRWPEWEPLTLEILHQLSAETVVVVCMGNVAYSLASQIPHLSLIHVSHPSPLGVSRGKVPFAGSRIFTTINCKLRDIGQRAIDWRL